MLFLSFLKWWYSSGFLNFLQKFWDQLRNAADFFSIRLIVRNFFAPFRQISAEKSKDLSLNARLHAFFDYILSCFIGAMIRFVILIAGIIVILVQFILGLVGVVLWPLAPAFVCYFVVLFANGVTF